MLLHFNVDFRVVPAQFFRDVTQREFKMVLNSRPRPLEFKFQLCNLLAVNSQAVSLTLLYLSFLIPKMGIKIAPSHRAGVRSG